MIESDFQSSSPPLEYFPPPTSEHSEGSAFCGNGGVSRYI